MNTIGQYQHRFYDRQTTQSHKATLPVGKVVCVGRNYMDHIQELNNQVSAQPILFMKPSSALCDVTQPVIIPDEQGECHNEIEIALLIGKHLPCFKQPVSVERLRDAVVGIGLGLDLTLRDLQSELKNKGQPWERAKSFDRSCPVSPFVAVNGLNENDTFHFALDVNNARRQTGDTRLLLTPKIALLQEIVSVFSLMPGDVVLTGTPKGVAALQEGDQLTLHLNSYFKLTTSVMTP